MTTTAADDPDLPLDEPLDGRVARSRRTRDAIVEACISLVEEGDLKPTTPRIAERAGVSVRSVFQHFEGLEQLFAAVADRVVHRVALLILPIDPTLPLAERIARYAEQRAAILEQLGPMRRAALVHGPFSEEITARVRDGHLFLRLHTAEVFEPELAPLSTSRVEEVLDVLDTILSWPSWDNLRVMNRRSVPEARATVQWMLEVTFAALGEAPTASQPLP